MKILITGGSGFIGTHLCMRFLAQGHQVFCLDSHSPTNKPDFQLLLTHPKLQFIQHDVVDPIDIAVDQIYHFACPASPVRYRKDPVKTLQTAIWGTKNMLDLATKQRIILLQASSSEVYGHSLQHPQSEENWGNVNCVGMNSCYKEGKRAAETLCMDYFRHYGTSIRIIRIFNTYGPLMDPDDGRVIPSFIMSALQNQTLNIFGNGITRSFQYIDDLLEGIELMMQHPQFTGPVNLGNPVETSILDLAHLILELTGSQSSICHFDAHADDSIRRCPDISLAKTKLSWQPKTSLRVGLSKTIEYFKKIPQL